MAYGVRYIAEWRTKTRGERLYSISILEEEYTGDVSTMYLTGECATLTFGNNDQSELAPIKSSELELTILCTEEGNPYTSLFTLSPTRFKVEVAENDTLIWRGYISTGDYSQPLSKPPYQVRIRANDGLAILMGTPYLDGNGDKYIGNTSISNLFNRLLTPIADNIDIWHYDLLYAKQTSPTFDIAAIDESAIYQAYGEEVPTYYDVLRDIAEALGVQCLQHNGVWAIRSLSSLAIASHNRLMPLVSLDEPEGSRYGLSSSATLSLLPPIGKMSYASSSEGGSRPVDNVVCDRNNWHRTEMDSVTQLSNRYAPILVPVNKSVLKVVTPLAPPSDKVMSSAYVVLPYVLQRSQTQAIKVSFDLLNPSSKNKCSLYVGLWLIDANYDGEVVDFTRIDYAYNQCTFTPGTKLVYWDGSNWGRIAASLDTPISSQLQLMKTTVEASEKKSSILQIQDMAKATVSFELPSIPSILNAGTTNEYCTSWKMVLVVAPSAARSQVLISQPQISSEVISESSDVEISDDGIDHMDLSPKWTTARNFFASIVDLSNRGRAVYGYINAEGYSTTDKITSVVRDYRDRVTYEIDGEADKVIGYGCNNACEVDGRKFYTNYVRHHLQRGVAEVQLREMTALNTLDGSISLGKQFVDRNILYGIPGAVFFVAGTMTKQLILVNTRDFNKSVICEVKTSTTYPYSISKGVGCIVLGEYGGSDYVTRVTAYDSKGEILSEVVDFSDETISETKWYATARYDAKREIWLATDGERVVVMCDKEGNVTSKWTISGTLSAYNDAEVLIYDGGFIYRVADASNSYYCYWHSYDIHEAETFEGASWGFGSTNIRMVNSRFIVYATASGAYSIHIRNSVDIADLAGSSTVSLTSGYEVMSINDGMVLTRGSNGAAIYDFRSTTSNKYYLLSLGDATTAMTLSGDYAISGIAGVSNLFTARRIIPKVNNLLTIADDE